MDHNKNGQDFENQERPSTSKDELKKNPGCWQQAKNTFVEKENALRESIQSLMLRNGKWFAQIVAILALLVTLLYMAITFLDNVQYPTIINNWYITIEQGVVVGMFIMYLLNWYISPDRLTYTYSNSDSIISLICIIPILTMEDLTMKSDYFAMVGISRYARIYYSFKIIQQHVEFGANEVDQQINKSLLTFLMIIIISAGVFAEIENGDNVETYKEKGDGSGEWEVTFKEEHTYLYFNDSFYFVMVTLSTVGYGDINPTSTLGELVALFILLITLIYVPT